MRLNIDFSRLEAALLSIGGKKAEIGHLRSSRQILNPIELQIIEKGSLILSGADLAENLSKTAGLLAIGNTQITLHIYEPFEDRESLSSDPALKTRFHLADCKTIEDMRDKGRENRYVSSIRQDGFFEVRPLKDSFVGRFMDSTENDRDEKMAARLLPCHHCLTLLNYDGYAELFGKEARDQAKLDFSVETFFDEHKTIFRNLPIYTPGTFPEGGYSKEWSKISRELRHNNDWLCSCCGLNCGKLRSLLHVHHKDGNRGNERLSNLEVVCLACHKSRPLHGHLYYPMDERIKLERARRSQGLPEHCSNCAL
jgi:hypothetical protein